MNMKLIKKVSLIAIVVLFSFKRRPNTTIVSWYGPGFNGKLTANGEIFNQNEYTCASPNLPFNTLVEVTNLENLECIVVRVNDRGPYKMDKHAHAIFPLEPHPKRKFDLSKAAFGSISSLDKGLIQVSYKILNQKL